MSFIENNHSISIYRFNHVIILSISSRQLKSDESSEIKFLAGLKPSPILGRLSSGAMLYNVTYGSGVARREPTKEVESESPFSRGERERSSLGGIKSNQNHAALSPFRSRKIQPLHIALCGVSSSIGYSPSPPLDREKRAEKLDRCPVLSIRIPLSLPSRENAPGSRTGPEDANQIHETEWGEEKKKYELGVARIYRNEYGNSCVDSVRESRSNRTSWIVSRIPESDSRHF